jgi:hypothetical protein
MPKPGAMPMPCGRWGAGTPRIYLQHILPNIAGALLVQMTLNFPETIVLEAGLSFLGMGAQPPLTSLGLMVNDSRNYIVNAWWMAAAPSAVIVLTTLSISVFGDWLRDQLTGDSQGPPACPTSMDPRLGHFVTRPWTKRLKDKLFCRIKGLGWCCRSGLN